MSGTNPGLGFNYGGTILDLSSLDFGDHSSRVSEIIGVNVGCIVVILSIITLRAIVRFKVVRPFGLGIDDGERLAEYLDIWLTRKHSSLLLRPRESFWRPSVFCARGHLDVEISHIANDQQASGMVSASTSGTLRRGRMGPQLCTMLKTSFGYGLCVPSFKTDVQVAHRHVGILCHFHDPCQV